MRTRGPACVRWGVGERAAERGLDALGLRPALLRAFGVVSLPLLMGLTANFPGQFFVPIGKYHIPMTLQTLWMALAAILLGPRYGTASMGVYLGLGLVGVPMFTDGAHGPEALFGQTCGYLFGFLLCQPVFGRIAAPTAPGGGIRRSPSVWRVLAGLTAAQVIVFGLGVAWLFGFLVMMNAGEPGGAAATLRSAVFNGFVIFIPAEVLKMGIAAAVAWWVLPTASRRLW